MNTQITNGELVKNSTQLQQENERMKETQITLLHQIRGMVHFLNSLEKTYKDYELDRDEEEGYGIGTEIDIDEIKQKRDFFVQLLIEEIPKTDLVERFYKEYIHNHRNGMGNKKDYYLEIPKGKNPYGKEEGYVITIQNKVYEIEGYKKWIRRD